MSVEAFPLPAQRAGSKSRKKTYLCLIDGEEPAVVSVVLLLGRVEDREGEAGDVHRHDGRHEGLGRGDDDRDGLGDDDGRDVVLLGRVGVLYDVEEVGKR